MKLSILVLFFSSLNSFALLELNAEYGLSKSVYGTENQNEIQTTTHSASIAWYVFSVTAIELNFMQSKNANQQNLTNPGTGAYLSTILSEVTTESYGIGIRQMLAPSKSPFLPMISIGYAKEINEYTTTYTIVDPDSSTSTEITESPLEVEEDSVFATFALQIRFSDHFRIKGSVSSFFPAFEYDRWDNDLRYTAGISIFFF